MYRRIVIGSIAALGLLVASAANAASGSGAYIGLGGGRAALNDKASDVSKFATAFKAFSGYGFGDYLAFEAAYIYGGKASKDIGAGGVNDVSASAYNATILFRARTGGALAVYGKLGYGYYRMKSTNELAGVKTVLSNISDGSLTYGLGITYTFRDKYIVRLEAEAALKVRDNDFMTGMLGVGYKF